MRKLWHTLLMRMRAQHAPTLYPQCLHVCQPKAMLADTMGGTALLLQPPAQAGMAEAGIWVIKRSARVHPTRQRCAALSLLGRAELLELCCMCREGQPL